MPTSTRVLNTEILFDMALDAANRINAPQREGGKRDALISIVFAAISLEAFLNELVELAQDFCEYENVPPGVSTFAPVMSELSRLPILQRFKLAHLVLTSSPYDTSSEPFQSLTLLFQVRNDLVHFKPDPLEDDGSKPTHTTLEKLKSRNILNDSPLEEHGRSWMHSVGTKAVAEWACNSTSLVAADFISRIPEGLWKDAMEKVSEKIVTVHFPAHRPKS